MSDQPRYRFANRITADGSSGFTTFTAPGAVFSDWNAPHAREELNRVSV